MSLFWRKKKDTSRSNEFTSAENRFVNNMAGKSVVCGECSRPYNVVDATRKTNKGQLVVSCPHCGRFLAFQYPQDS